MTGLLYKSTTPTRQINWQNFILIALCLLSCIVSVVDLAIGSGILLPVLVALIGFAVSIYYLPELPFVILHMGMAIWLYVGNYLPIADQAAFITVIWAFICVSAHRLFFVRETTERFRFDPCDLAMGLFTAWIWLSLGWSSNTSFGLDKALGFTVLSGVVYFLIRFGFGALRFSPTRLAHLMVGAGLGYVFALASVSFQLGLWGFGASARKQFFIKKIWGISPVASVDSLALGLLATTALFLLARNRNHKLLYGIAYLLQLWAFSTFQQRGATIALLVGTAFLYFLLSGRRDANIFNWRRLGPVAIGVVLLPLLAFLLYWLNPSFQSAYLASDTSYLSRFVFFRIGIDAFWDSPVIGAGIGGLGSALRAGFDEFYVHNRVLEIMSELGIVGLLLIGAVTVLLYQHLRRGLTKADSTPYLLGLSIAGAALLQRYTLGMSGGDLIGWRIGLWAGLAVSFYVKVNQSNEIVPDTENDSPSLVDSEQIHAGLQQSLPSRS